VKMYDWLQIPEEAFWLETYFRVFIRVLMNLWEKEADLANVKAYSNWLLDLIDIRGWSHFYESESADDLIRNGRGGFILMLLTPTSDMPKETKTAYWDWLDERVS
ncbi:hypothetical protein, partial [Paenibacillus riograndensis]